MSLVFNIAQITLSVLLCVAILLQAKGSGLGSAFGGEGNVYQTRRGAEKVLFWSTIVMSVLFFGIALTRLLIKT